MPSPERSGQPSLRRMREWQIRPDHALGQCFLADSNILPLISDAAELAPGDTVLEVGGGLGVLSEHLAERAGHVHVVEIDRRLQGPLVEALSAHPNTTLHWGDALKLDLAALDPAPVALVANLPYGIAAQLLLRSIFELPSLTRWVAMVQREVGERLAAKPGGAQAPARSAREYGAASVLAQLACEVKVLRAISRQVFRPVPRVDSALLAMRRIGAPPAQSTRDFVHGAFAHRRKPLLRSLLLAQQIEADEIQRAHAALAELGHAPEVRAERLAPAELAALAQLLGR